MVQTLIANMIEFGKSMPTNLLVIVIICLIMKFGLRKSTKDCIKIVLVYLLAGVLLGMVGICMPDFITIFNWIKGLIW